jgi:hypothetical protein
MNSRLPDEAWWSIANDLPQSYWWQDWDRCERLRKGVVERFRSERWPASALLEITTDDILFDALVAELRDSKSGRRVLKEAAERGAMGRRRAVILSD